MPLSHPRGPAVDAARAALRACGVLIVVALIAVVLLLMRAVGAPAALAAHGFTAPSAATQAASELVYSSFLGDRSEFWAASPTALQQPRRIATVSHADGFGLRASLSPRGRHIAYLTLPRGSYDGATQGVLWLMAIDGSGGRTLAEGLDAVRAPVWSPDGRRVAVRRAHPEPGDVTRYSLVVVDVARGEVSVPLPPMAGDGIYPFGWSDDSRSVYLAVIASGGTDFLRVGLDGSSAGLVHASDGIARDFRLAPDGTRVVYNEAPSGAASPYRLLTAALTTGQITELNRGAEPLLSPLWRPGSASIVAGSGPGPLLSGGGLVEFGAGGAAAPTLLLAAPQGGLAVPLGWPSEGRWLAAQQLTGSNLARITSARLVVVDQVGGRTLPITSAGYLEFVGWSGGG